MEELNISLTDLGRIARYNGWVSPGHNASNFAAALSKNIPVNVSYSGMVVLRFRDGSYQETVRR